MGFGVPPPPPIKTFGGFLKISPFPGQTIKNLVTFFKRKVFFPQTAKAKDILEKKAFKREVLKRPNGVGKKLTINSKPVGKFKQK